MPAYWISNYREVLDADKLAAYAALAGPALVEAGGTSLAQRAREENVEPNRLQKAVSRLRLVLRSCIEQRLSQDS